MKAQLLVALFLLLTSIPGQASFTLIDDQNGKKFRCTEVATTGVADPQCIEKLRNYCRANSGYSANECFDRSTTACGLGAEVKDCVPKAAATCRASTSFSSKECFDRALIGCGAR
jgi:hypothetical protein